MDASDVIIHPASFTNATGMIIYCTNKPSWWRVFARRRWKRSIVYIDLRSDG